MFALLVHQDPRLSYAKEILQMKMGLSDKWKSVHYQAADLADECYIFLEQCGRCYSITVPFYTPAYRKWLLGNNCEEMKKSYWFHKRFLQHLQRQRETKRWVLKMPFHMFTMDELMKTYPDAKVIFMHRDPVDVVGSWCSLVRTTRSILNKDVNLDTIGAEELDALSTMTSNASQFRKAHRELDNRFVDVHYDDFIQNPFKTLRRVYDTFDISMPSDLEEKIDNYLVKDKKSRASCIKHNYSLKEFGLTREAVDAAFKSKDYDHRKFMLQKE